MRIVTSILAGWLGIAGASEQAKPSAHVVTIGESEDAAIVVELIHAAEAGDAESFQNRIGQSAESADQSPTMEDVDRTDEGCSVKFVDATIPTKVSVIWRCGDNSIANIERSFLVENGKVVGIENAGADFRVAK